MFRYTHEYIYDDRKTVLVYVVVIVVVGSIVVQTTN